MDLPMHYLLVGNENYLYVQKHLLLGMYILAASSDDEEMTAIAAGSFWNHFYFHKICPFLQNGLRDSNYREHIENLCHHPSY